MNRKILLPLRKGAAFGLLFLMLFLLCFRAKAQAPPLAGPNFPDQLAGNSGLATVNTAMIQCSPLVDGFLSAVIWSSPSGTNLYLTHSGGQTLTLLITNAALSSKPDVILGTTPIIRGWIISRWYAIRTLTAI